MAFLCGLAVVMQMGATGPGNPDALNVGGDLQLFVDRYVVQSMDGAVLRLGVPVPGETVLAFDAPWEGRHCGYVTVLKDGDLYRMYYRGLPVDGADGSDAETTCYAESRDGRIFEKPNLGLFEVAGSRENNVILAGMPPLSHNFAPMLDDRPGSPPEERFKALAGISESGLVGFVSADGVRWQKLRDEPLITAGAFDSQNVAFWSESEQCYVAYFRTWSQGTFAGYRTVSRSTSPDFRTWSAPVPMTFGDTPIEHLYTNQTTPYFRAPQIYIAIAARFMPGRRVVSVEQAAAFGGEATYSGDCSDTVFMSSRGGAVYDRTFMEGFVRPGIGLENWTSRTNYPARGIVPTGDTEMSFYVQRNYGQPTHHLQRMTLRTDGFVSINAPYSGGECVIKPLLFEGKELVVNYSTSAAGGLRIELQDRDGKPIPGFACEDADEIVGDEIARVVSWKGNRDVSTLEGTPVRIRFVMKDADLFSIRFRR